MTNIFPEVYQLLLAVGIMLAAVDMLVLGFSTFFLTIIGLSTILTGVFVAVGLIPESSLAISLSIAVLSAINAVLLYKPLLRLQNKDKVVVEDVHSDLTNMNFVLEQDVSPQSPVNYHFSGIDWKLKSGEFLSAGTEVRVTKLAVGEMYIVKASPAVSRTN